MVRAAEQRDVCAQRRRGGTLWAVIAILAVLAFLGVGALVVASGQRGGSGAGTGAGARAPERDARQPASPEAVEAILESARRHAAAGESGQARAVLRAAVEQHAMVREFRLALAELLVAQQDYAGAYAEYEAALAIGPRDPATEFAAGIAAQKSGRPERAVEHYATAQAGDPSNAAYALWLGQAQLALGRTAEGKASVLRAANLDPDNATAWGLLADTALRENKLDLALQHVARARRLEPDAAAWRVIEARALKRQGKPEAALLVLGTIEQGQPSDPGVLRLMGECYGLLDRPRDAAELFARASDRKPGSAELAREAAAWLDRAGDAARAAEYRRRAETVARVGG